MIHRTIIIAKSEKSTFFHFLSSRSKTLIVDVGTKSNIWRVLPNNALFAQVENWDGLSEEFFHNAYDEDIKGFVFYSYDKLSRTIIDDIERTILSSIGDGYFVTFMFGSL